MGFAETCLLSLIEASDHGAGQGCHTSRRGRYRTRTCDPLLVRNKWGLEYMGFAAPTPVFMRFWVLAVVGCFVLLRSGWCPRGAPGS